MTNTVRLGPMVLENRCCAKSLAAILRSCSNSANDKGESSSPKNRPMVTAAELEMHSNSNNKNDIDDLEVPTTCCMSGCANCVWIQYAELLSEKLKNSDENLQKIIMDKIEDPNMRAFLSMELKCRNIGKS